MRFYILCMFFLLLQTIDSGIYAQDNSVITGRIINGEDKEPLPFASIRLKNHQIRQMACTKEAQKPDSKENLAEGNSSTRLKGLKIPPKRYQLPHPKNH